MDILGIVGGLATGGVGSVLGGVVGLGKSFLADRHALKMAEISQKEGALERAHDLALADKEIERVTTEAQLKLDETMFRVDSKALSVASVSQDKEISALGQALEGSYVWVRSMAAMAFTGVTVIQKLTRVIITGVLMALTWRVYGEINALVGGLDALPTTEIMEIYRGAIRAVESFTGFAITFWFVTRPHKK